MKSLLLLILPLMTGGEVTVNGCPGGWVDFTCKYLGIKKYTSVEVVKDGSIVIKCDDEDFWVNKDRFSVMLDTNKKEVKVAIRDIQEEDFGNYKCKVKDEDFGNYKYTSNSDSDSDEDEEDKVKLRRNHNCQQTFIQTAYRTADTTISCDNTATFICKYNSDSFCEDILSRNSLESNGPFTLTETTDSFRMSISNVSPEHAGVYFCGDEERGLYRVLLRKIQLQVEDAGGSWVTVTIVVVVCVTVLVFLIISALCYKRLQHLKSKSNEDQNNKDHTYEEIEESHQKPGSGVELKTIYATASAPTNPSATEFYSTINLNDSSGKVSGDIDQNPTYSTVNHPSRLNEDPFYSTVNKPQQH